MVRRFFPVVLLSLMLPTLTAQACSDRTKPIAVGGVFGFRSLMVPKHSVILRNSCKVSLYIHDYIWDRIKGGNATRRAILRVFRGTGPAVVELPVWWNGPGYFNGYYRSHYLDLGVVAHQANVNGSLKVTLAQWHSYVSGARGVGFKVVAPVFAPNVAANWHGDQVDPALWDRIKARAMVGGGLTVDAPPAFFFWYTPAYRRFVVHEIRWGKRHNLLVTLIISPDVAGANFLIVTEKMISYLQSHRALANRFVVENYEIPVGVKNYVNVVGSEDN
ncbi:MAG: hypothetical protein B7Z67_04520 [Acidiphilium sp. 21-60-14]|nr:MAG: hypothetical protein B7Z67_04520 [Acidiphilium sp. 21-60-14]